ncbi:hypothetical protein ABE093_01765 [Solilutibacter silvestris]
MAIARCSGVLVFQHVAEGCPAAGAEPLTHVLPHAGQTLLAAGQAVPLVHRLQDGLQQHLGDRIGFRKRFVDQPDIEALALALEHHGEMPAAGNARRVQHQQGVPAALRVPDRCDQVAEAGPVIVLSGLDRIRELSDYTFMPRLCEGLQFSTLGVDTDVVSVLA